MRGLATISADASEQFGRRPVPSMSRGRASARTSASGGAGARGVVPPREDELLSAEAAAKIAERSVRTIRRAYLEGTLVAYRDGGGRGIRILYGDLRQWLMSTSAAGEKAKQLQERKASQLRKRRHFPGKVPATLPSDNLALLNAARARRKRRASG